MGSLWSMPFHHIKNSDFLSSLLCVFFFTLLLRTFVEVAVKRSRCFYAFDANLSKLSWLLMLWWKTFAVGLVMAQQIHVLTKITLINILFIMSGKKLNLKMWAQSFTIWPCSLPEKGVSHWNQSQLHSYKEYHSWLIVE